MKNLIFGLGMSCIVIITALCCMTISGRNVRQNEVDRALNTAIEQTVGELQEKKTYRIENQEEFIADFIEGLLIKIESDSEIEVKVAGVDQEKGVLSVKVTEHFKHPNGKPGTAEAERTVILESYSLDKKKTFTITYKVGDTDYKVYTLTEGSPLLVPAAPEGNFTGWTDENGQAADPGNQVADADKVFYAKME